MLAIRVRLLMVVGVLVPALLGVSSSAGAVSSSEAFDNVWNATDQAVASGSASYSWFWGPAVRDQRFETYHDSPGGQREVRYYDKSRMEINNPNGDQSSIYYVTNGLLTEELVTGQRKLGDAPTDVEQREPASQLVAGDPANNPGTPSYAAFANYVTTDGATNRATDQTGQPATGFMSGTGQVGAADSRGVTLARYEGVTGHNIASVFWDWFNNPASGFRPDIGINWVYVAGLPISEPFWIDSTVAGTPKRVLVQLFERRVLTYTDSNNDPYRVEWGNIGQHYQNWNDAGTGAAPCPDSPAGTYVYVADQFNDRIQKFDGAGNFVCQWVGDYDLDGPGGRPQAIAVDGQNNVYVNALGRIEKYDQRGRFLGNWGTSINAWDIALDSAGNLYATDVASASVMKYGPNGDLLTQWGGLGAGDGQFDSPTGIAVDAQDNVYVADSNNDRIQKFTAAGAYLGQWSADGQEADLWGSPASVAVDGAGNTYATSSRVYKFGPNGAFLDVWGDPGDITGSGDIDVAADGSVFALDRNNTAVRHYTSDGAPLGAWGAAGAGEGQFNSPVGIAAATR